MEETEFNIRVLSLRDKMFRFARTILSSGSEAEDATHDTLERMWRHRERLDECRNVEAFVMTSLRNGCCDVLRRRRAAIVSDKAAEHLPAPSDAERWSVKEMVVAAIAELPPRQREAIHLRDIEGYDTDQIATMLSTDPSQVRVLLSRARKQLRERIEKFTDYETERD